MFFIDCIGDIGDPHTVKRNSIGIPHKTQPVIDGKHRLRRNHGPTPKPLDKQLRIETHGKTAICRVLIKGRFVDLKPKRICAACNVQLEILWPRNRKVIPAQ